MTRQRARAEHQCVDRLQINSHTALALVTCHFRKREGWGNEKKITQSILGPF